MAEESRKQLLADVMSIWKNALFTDLTIQCGADTYHVHKSVLASRSGVIAKALKFPGKESEEGHVDLSDNEPKIVKLLVQYVYEADYDPGLLGPDPTEYGGNAPQTEPHTCSKVINGIDCEDGGNQRQVCPHHYCGSECRYDCNGFICNDCITVTGDADQLIIHAKMYEMADKYEISGLKSLCIEKYTRACAKFWDDVKFAESAYHAFSTTPTRDKGLRNVVCKTISKHMELLEKPEIEDLMNEFNGLAFGLLFDKAKQAGWCK